ncbi:hypothetical protein IMSAGC012_01169 [Lachnospiraceae bacterium]|jgi:hypothetical protein|nr:hypothetical protein [Eubacterium sp.]MCI9209867.1 hypothetical protein [Eubacterium sp.]GFI26053.1 hypothetical protein IMSAGC012_01169 [Lachnospiraceae bacterium]
MDEIFKQYGSTIITVLAITAVIGIITLVIGKDTNSIVYQAFSDLIRNFYSGAGGVVPGA